MKNLKQNKACLNSSLGVLFNNNTPMEGQRVAVALVSVRLWAVHEDLDFVQQSPLSLAHPGRRHGDNSPLLNRGPLKMHARSRLCIFNEVCLKYLIASCSFGKQIRLFSWIFDAEMNKCKTYTLISPFLSIVTVCYRLDVSVPLAPHRLRWHAQFCDLLF